MPSFGNMFASLTLESASFMSGLDAARKSLGNTQKTFAKVGAQMQGIGAVMTVGITAPFTALISTAIPAAVESQQALAQVNASLASMGPIAGRTTEQLQALAGKLQDTSNFDDDDILKSLTANLLTFGKVQGEVFDRASQAAVDLSVKFSQDLQTSTMQLGKALNDPVKGVAALTKVGVSFTAQQKEQIAAMVAAGNAAGAQGVILAELERQVGGAAQAQRDATPTADMDQAWRTFNETVGGVAMEVLPNIANGLAIVLNAFNALPSSVQTGVVAAAAFAAAAGPVTAAIGGIVSVVGTMLPLLAQIGPILMAVRAAIMVNAIPALISFSAAAAPILLPIAAVSAAILGVVWAIRNWDTIKIYIAKVVAWVSELYAGVKTWLVDKLKPVWDALIAPIKLVAKAFNWLTDVVVRHSYVPEMVDLIGQHMRRLDGEMVAPARAATGATADMFAKLRDEVQPILDRLFPEQAKHNAMLAEIETLQRALPKLGFTAEQTAEAVQRARDAYLKDQSGAVQTGGFELVEPVVDVVEVLGTTVGQEWEKIGAANDNLKANFEDTFRSIVSAAQGLADRLRNGDWLDVIEGVLDVFMQLGRAGVFGAGMQTRIEAPPVMTLAGARATGGPVLPGRSYLVGERGPEILRMGSRGGGIVPNDQIGGSAVVQLVVGEGQMFEPRVTGISGNVSVQTVRGAQRSAALRGRQRYG